VTFFLRPPRRRKPALTYERVRQRGGRPHILAASTEAGGGHAPRPTAKAPPAKVGRDLLRLAARGGDNLITPICDR